MKNKKTAIGSFFISFITSLCCLLGSRLDTLRTSEHHPNQISPLKTMNHNSVSRHNRIHKLSYMNRCHQNYTCRNDCMCCPTACIRWGSFFRFDRSCKNNLFRHRHRRPRTRCMQRMTQSAKQMPIPNHRLQSAKNRG